MDVMTLLALERGATQARYLPDASAEWLGRVVQFIGESTAEFLRGHFYACAETALGYEWQHLDFGIDTSGVLRFDVAQALTESQKTRARANIGADKFVSYGAAQTMTEAQKQTARGNIGAASGAAVDALEDNMDDLAQEVEERAGMLSVVDGELCISYEEEDA